MPLPHQNSPEVESDTLELNEYQELTLEQQEAMDRIAAIDEKIRTVDVIINSIDQRSDGRRVHSDLGDEINTGDEQIMEKGMVGEDTSELETDLFEKKARYAEGEELYGGGEQKDRMFNKGLNRDFNKLRGKDAADIDESTRALIDTLGELGLDTDSFQESLKDSCYDGISERDKAAGLIRDFKKGLILERNTERLSLPNELPKMTAELLQKTKAAELDNIHLMRSFTRNNDPAMPLMRLYEAIPSGYALDAYPDEVKEKYFTQIAKKILGANEAAGYLNNSSEIGKALSEIYTYQSESMREKSDIEHELQVFEKVLGYAQNEEAYLKSIIKGDKQIVLVDKIDTFGIRFEPDSLDKWEDETPQWPILDPEVRFEEEDRRFQGNITPGRDLAHFSKWKQTMEDALAIIKIESPYQRTVDPIDVIVALRKAVDKVKAKQEEVQTEKEQLEMHERYLEGLKKKEVILRR